MMTQTEVRKQEDCDICLQPKGLGPAIENTDLPLVCFTCLKSINMVRGWFRRHGLEVRLTQEPVNRETGEISENGRTSAKEKAAKTT